MSTVWRRLKQFKNSTSIGQEVSEHRGHPGTGNSKGLVWRFERLMFGYFLPVTCREILALTIDNKRVRKRNNKRASQSGTSGFLFPGGKVG